MRVLGAAVAPLRLVGWQPLAAHAQPSTCSGVWVVVEDELSCATEFTTGEQALLSAGHNLEKKGSMLCRIDGHPDRCVVTFDGYWSYWQSSRRADGSYEPWKYANVGAASYQPRAGDAEGWAYGPGEPPPITPPPDSYRPEDGEIEPAPSPEAGAGSSPIPTIAALAVVAVGGTALRVAARRREGL